MKCRVLWCTASSPFRTVALVRQLPGVCRVTVLILVPPENCMQLKAAALSKVMPLSQEAAHIHCLGIQRCEGQALLLQSGKNMKGNPNSRTPYKIGWALCYNAAQLKHLPTPSCFLHSFTDASSESSIPQKRLMCKFPSQGLFSGNSTITL